MPFWMLASVTEGLSSAAWLRRRHLGPLGPQPPLALISLPVRSIPSRRKLKKETEACCRNTFRIVDGHRRGALRSSPGIRLSLPLPLNLQEALVRLLGARFEIATFRLRPHIPHQLSRARSPRTMSWPSQPFPLSSQPPPLPAQAWGTQHEPQDLHRGAGQEAPQQLCPSQRPPAPQRLATFPTAFPLSQTLHGRCVPAWGTAGADASEECRMGDTAGRLPSASPHYP